MQQPLYGGDFWLQRHAAYPLTFATLVYRVLKYKVNPPYFIFSQRFTHKAEAADLEGALNRPLPCRMLHLVCNERKETERLTQGTQSLAIPPPSIFLHSHSHSTTRSYILSYFHSSCFFSSSGMRSSSPLLPLPRLPLLSPPSAVG